MYTELGAAISHYIGQGKPKIFVIGDHTSRSPFYFHTSVNRRKTFDEVLAETEGM